MAAETILQVFVSPLLGTVFENLTLLIKSEFGLIRGVNRELKKLSNTLSTIRDVFEDAEDKQLKDKSILNWLKKLKDVAYEAVDILDDFTTEAAIRTKTGRVETSQSCNNVHEVLPDSVSSCFSFKRISFRRSIAKRIVELREKFDEIAIERSNFHLYLSFASRYVRSGAHQRKQTSSYLVEPQVYGREEDKECIVNQLLNITGVDANNAHQGGDVSICAILGMGRIGKTTLAQMVHNDDRIVRNFEVRCWVCVSENFDPTTLFKAIIESSGGLAHDLDNLDPLQRRLQEILSGKKFLMVLDDVWNEDQAKWNIVKSVLTCGSRGSSIIITTRLETIASITATLSLYRLKVLSEEDCWSLFKHRAFHLGNNEEKCPNLKAVGKEIVKKCGGVPLAAKSLGGLLRFKREEKEWLSVRE